MFVQFLRNNIWASWILTFLRIWLGWKWINAGWGKISGGDFSVGGFLNHAIANPVASHGEVVYPRYVAFLENVALHWGDLFSILVPWGQLFVGLGLIVGALTTTAVFFGLVMNFAFLMAGAISMNPLMILVGMFVAVAGPNAGKIGLDRWVLPFLKNLVFNNQISKNSVDS